MFSWICPKCGKEVPPAYSDCPNCAVEAKTAQPAPAHVPVPPASTSAPAAVAPLSSPPPTFNPAPARQAPPPDTYQPPPSQWRTTAQQPVYEPPPPQAYAAPPPQPQYAPPPPQTYAPPQPTGPVFGGTQPLPQKTTAMAQILAVLLTIALVGLIFFAVQYFRSRGRAPETQSAQATKLEQPTGPPPASAHPLAKFLEVTGVRLTENRGRRFVKVLVVNHSQADLPDLALRINVKAADKQIVEFPVDLQTIGPYESRDVQAEVKLDLKPYEMPDWRYLKATFEITSQP